MLKLSKYIENNIDKAQVGAIKGGECFLNIAVLMDVISNLNVLQKITFFIIFLDLKDAYGSLNREILYEMLRSREALDKNEIQLLNFILTNTEITINGKKGIKTSSGVYQGHLSSAFSFVIYIDEFFKGIKKVFKEKYIKDEMVNTNLTALGYIDDTAFIVKTVEDLTVCTTSIKKECKRLDLTLNFSKSAI